MSSLSEPGLVALTWTFTAVGIVLTAGRYYIRKRIIGSFDWDDLTHGLAVIVLIGYISTYYTGFNRDYVVEFWSASGGTQEPPSDSVLKAYFRGIVGATMQFWVCIYLIKLSFLLFYRKIFGVNRNFMRAWWIVAIFQFITFWACFLAPLWSCVSPSQLFVVKVCLSDLAITKTVRFVKMWCGLNVASDLSIMALPLWMIYQLKLRTSHKIGLAFVFTLAFVDIVFDILRTIYTVNGGALALDTLWDILEPTIAVIISCLPTYTVLLKSSKKPQPARTYATLEDESKAARNYSSHGSSHELDTIPKIPGNANEEEANERDMA